MESRNTQPDDGAWQNQFTEEDLPPPAKRDDAAHDQLLDPSGDPEAARKIIKGEKDRSTKP